MGFWDNFHHFVKRIDTGYMPKYIEIKCTDDDIENENLNDMIKYHVSR